MKTTMNLFLTIGLIACTLTFSSCNNDDNYETVKRPTALVTVYPNGSEGFIMQLDDSTSLVPTNMKESPFGEKKCASTCQLHSRISSHKVTPQCVCELD